MYVSVLSLLRVISVSTTANALGMDSSSTQSAIDDRSCTESILQLSECEWSTDISCAETRLDEHLPEQTLQCNTPSLDACTWASQGTSIRPHTHTSVGSLGPIDTDSLDASTRSSGSSIKTVTPPATAANTATDILA